MTDPIDIVRRCYQAYIDNDRPAIEAVIAEDFVFTSPRDNRLDRATYFTHCWPGHQHITGFTYRRLFAEGDTVFVTYEGETDSGRRFRNTEVLTLRHGKIAEAEVYFGWSLPHPAPLGGFIDT